MQTPRSILFPLRVRQGLFIMGFLMLIVFLGMTFPWRHNSAPSALKFEVLSPRQWRVGYVCYESDISPAAGYRYGFVEIRREYYFRPGKSGSVAY